jgi:hypothetical protein
MSDSSMYFSIYDATDSTLCCALSSAYSQPSNTTQIEFTQLFEDGSIINVNNNPLFDIYPKWDKNRVIAFRTLTLLTNCLPLQKQLSTTWVDQPN